MNYKDIPIKRPLTRNQLKGGDFYYQSKNQEKFISQHRMELIVGLFHHHVDNIYVFSQKRLEVHNKLRDLRQEYSNKVFVTFNNDIVKDSFIKNNLLEIRNLDEQSFEFLEIFGKLDEFFVEDRHIDFLVSLEQRDLEWLGSQYISRKINRMAVKIARILQGKKEVHRIK